MASALASAWRVQAVDDVSLRFTQPHIASHHLAPPHAISLRLTPSRSASRRLAPHSQRNADDEPTSSAGDARQDSTRNRRRHEDSCQVHDFLNCVPSIRDANGTQPERDISPSANTAPCRSVQIRADPTCIPRTDDHAQGLRTAQDGSGRLMTPHDASGRLRTLEMPESLHDKASCMRVQVRPSSTSVCMHPGSPQLCGRVVTTTDTCD